MLDALCGKWKLVSTENFETYLDVLDVDLNVRQAGRETDISILISQEGNKVTVKTVTPWGFSEFESLLGEEFYQITLDNRHVKCLLSDENGKLVLFQQWEDKENKIVREVRDGKLVTTFSCGGVSAIRRFERVQD